MGHSTNDVGATPDGNSRCDEQRGQRVIDAIKLLIISLLRCGPPLQCGARILSARNLSLSILEPRVGGSLRIVALAAELAITIGANFDVPAP
jgi:hypothetical protein